MLKNIAAIGVLGLFAGCATPPPPTPQEFLSAVKNNVSQSAFSYTDEARHLTITIPRNHLLSVTDPKRLSYNDYMGVSSEALSLAIIATNQGKVGVETEDFANNSCFLRSEIFNTGNQQYATVTAVITGSYLSDENAWVKFQTESRMAGFQSTDSFSTYFRLKGGDCPSQLKEVSFKFSTCVDVAIGDRRCQ